MSTEPAPVALFAFRRPDHLAATVQSLAASPQAPDTAVTVFCDGPRDESDVPDVEAVRALARGIEGFHSVSVVEQESNLGLAASVIGGVTAMLDIHERVIVLEDDMVVSPDFLAYMNAGLDLYADDQDVVSIHGYCYAVDEPLPQTFFLAGADCWGWGTWRRGWALFDPDGAGLLARLDASGRASEFDLDGSYPYRAMLSDQVDGRVDSWAIRWHASAFLAGGLTLYPGTSLVDNIGQDGSGTHAGASASHAVTAGRIDLPLRRIAVEESATARRAVARTLSRSHGSGLRSRLSRLVSRGR